MALIHEAIGVVEYDPQGEFPVGQRVVMIPNTPVSYTHLDVYKRQL